MDVTLGEAILAGDARAWGRLVDLHRAYGATYRQMQERVREIFVAAGKAPPSDEDFEDKMAEADELEAKG